MGSSRATMPARDTPDAQITTSSLRRISSIAVKSAATSVTRGSTSVSRDGRRITAYWASAIEVPSVRRSTRLPTSSRSKRRAKPLAVISTTTKRRRNIMLR